MENVFIILAHGQGIALLPPFLLLISLFFVGFPLGYRWATKPGSTLRHALLVACITGIATGFAYLLFGKELLWTIFSLPITFCFVRLVRSTIR